LDDDESSSQQNVERPVTPTDVEKDERPVEEELTLGPKKKSKKKKEDLELLADEERGESEVFVNLEFLFNFIFKRKFLLVLQKE